MITILKIALSIFHGCLGGWTGLQADLHRAQSPEERQYLIRVSLRLATAILVILALQFVAALCLPRPWPAVLMAGLLVTTVALARTDERLAEIEVRSVLQTKDASHDDAPAELSNPQNSQRRNMILGALGAIAGTNSWILLVFMRTADWISLGIVVFATCAAVLRIVRRLPDVSQDLRSRTVLLSAQLVPLGCIGLLIVYFRSALWQGLPAADLQMVTAINATMIMMGTLIIGANRWQQLKPLSLDC